jgi:hypothetical protein
MTEKELKDRVRYLADLIVDNGEGGAQVEIKDKGLRESLVINAEKQLLRFARELAEANKDLQIVMRCYERESDMPFEAYLDEKTAEARAKELNAGKVGACEYYRVDGVSIGRRPA